jgi:hypothetical protein
MTNDTATETTIEQRRAEFEARVNTVLASAARHFVEGNDLMAMSEAATAVGLIQGWHLGESWNL